jgi:hypothetical protein
MRRPEVSGRPTAYPPSSGSTGTAARRFSPPLWHNGFVGTAMGPRRRSHRLVVLAVGTVFAACASAGPHPEESAASCAQCSVQDHEIGCDAAYSRDGEGGGCREPLDTYDGPPAFWLFCSPVENVVCPEGLVAIMFQEDNGLSGRCFATCCPSDVDLPWSAIRRADAGCDSTSGGSEYEGFLRCLGVTCVCRPWTLVSHWQMDGIPTCRE